MAHEIESRDIQAGVAQAWHNLTTIVPVVTPEIAMPFEVIPCSCPIAWDGTPAEPQPRSYIEDNPYMRLVASDDKLPVAPPYNPETYTPSSVALFWTVIEEGLSRYKYEVISAGSIRNRSRIFASIKLRPAFKIGEREFVDFLTLLDSFDGSCALQARYSNICVVCANTFGAALDNGDSLGKAFHKKNLMDAAERITASINCYFSQAEAVEKVLAIAHATQVTLSEARCWIAGVDNAKKPKISMTDLQRTSRMAELFTYGKGNSGQSQLDAFSAVTEFHTHESSQKFKDKFLQWMSSEFGNSNDVKMTALLGLTEWDKHVAHGKKLLEGANAMID